MFRGYLVGRLYPRDTHENQLSPSVMTLRIPVMCRAHASFHGKASQELPAKTSCFLLHLESSKLSLTHNPYKEIPHKIQGT